MAIDEAIEAVDKQMPKKPKEYEDKFYACPNCENILLMKWKKYNTELKKCPFCGWGTIVDGGGFFSHACECNACHAKTKNYKTWEEAVEVWNRRAE